MKKLQLIGFALMAIMFLTSCGGPSVEDKYWVKKNRDDIIMFKSDNSKVVNINDDDEYPYTKDGDKILMTRGTRTDTIIVVSVDEENLVIKHGVNGADKDYRLAKNPNDFILGKWKSVVKGEKVKFRFEPNGEVSANGKDGMYKIDGETIKIDDGDFTFKLSEDYNTLELSGTADLILIRRR